MTRQFGLSSRPALGANTQGGPLSRGGIPREPVQLAGKTSRPANSRGANPEFLIAMERAAKWFCIGFFGAIGFGVLVCCIVLSQLIYWSDVWEALGLR